MFLRTRFGNNHYLGAFLVIYGWYLVGLRVQSDATPHDATPTHFLPS